MESLSTTYLVGLLKRKPGVFIKNLFYLLVVMPFIAIFIFTFTVPVINQFIFYLKGDYSTIDTSHEPNKHLNTFEVYTADCANVEIDENRGIAVFPKSQIGCQIYNPTSPNINFEETIFCGANMLGSIHPSSIKQSEAILSHNLAKNLNLNTGDLLSLIDPENATGYQDLVIKTYAVVGIMRPAYVDSPTHSDYQSGIVLIKDCSTQNTLTPDLQSPTYLSFAKSKTSDSISSQTKEEQLFSIASTALPKNGATWMMTAMAILLLFVICYREMNHLQELCKADFLLFSQLGASIDQLYRACLYGQIAIIIASSFGGAFILKTLYFEKYLGYYVGIESYLLMLLPMCFLGILASLISYKRVNRKIV